MGMRNASRFSNFCVRSATSQGRSTICVSVAVLAKQRCSEVSWITLPSLSLVLSHFGTVAVFQIHQSFCHHNLCTCPHGPGSSLQTFHYPYSCLVQTKTSDSTVSQCIHNAAALPAGYSRPRTCSSVWPSVLQNFKWNRKPSLSCALCHCKRKHQRPKRQQQLTQHAHAFLPTFFGKYGSFSLNDKGKTCFVDLGCECWIGCV